MIKLETRLRRETHLPFDHQGRNIVIEIEPPALVSFREKGRRRKYTANAAWLMLQVIKKDFDEKKRKLKPRRGRLHP